MRSKNGKKRSSYKIRKSGKPLVFKLKNGKLKTIGTAGDAAIPLTYSFATANIGIKTGRYINEFAKRSLQGNTSFSSFYSANNNDKNTSDSGVEAVKMTHNTIKSTRNGVVGVKNTIKGIDRSYRTGKRLYTAARGNVKYAKNAKIAIKRLKSVSGSIGKSINTIKQMIISIRNLFNPVVIKAAAAIIAVFLIIMITSSTMEFVTTSINSSFGWLYDDSNNNKKPMEVLADYRNKIFSMIDGVNNKYDTYVKKHEGYEYGFDEAGSEKKLRADIYLDVLSILIVQKQKLYEANSTDPTSVFDLVAIMKFKDAELQNILDRFYSLTTRAGTYYCSSTDCYGHSALYANLVNKNRESVMASLNFTSIEKARAVDISNYIVELTVSFLPSKIELTGLPNSKGFYFPTPYLSTITSPYGWRYHPVSGEYKFHYGVDISGVNAEGSAAICIMNGRVTDRGYDAGMGNYVVIQSTDKDGNVYISTYMHLIKAKVSTGSEVSAGTVVGGVGSTGLSTGTHLHFGLTRNGVSVDPMLYIEPNT